MTSQSNESRVSATEDSVSLQAEVGSERGTVLCSLGVLGFSRTQSVRKKSLRLRNRSAAFRRVLYPESLSLTAAFRRKEQSVVRRKVWSRPEGESSDEDSSVDEPLSLRQSVSAVGSSGVSVSESGQSEESEMEFDREDDVIFQGRSMVPLRQSLISQFFS
jgi:hypothetical protein